MGYGILGVQQEHPMEMWLETTKYKVLDFRKLLPARLFDGVMRGLSVLFTLQDHFCVLQN